MYHISPPIHLVEALAKAQRHWEQRHQRPDSGSPGGTRFVIAFSREAGTFGAAIAREVANRLGWPLYDSELLQHIAEDMGVRQSLLESVDERNASWLGEVLEGLSSESTVSHGAYFRRLMQTLYSLSTHGECVIVGRGATAILPPATTVRVRIVAPLEHRIEAVSQERGIPSKEAARHVAMTDEERNRFVKTHFQSDATDPRNYDLVLNTARFSQEQCADLILAALNSRKKAEADKEKISAVRGLAHVAY